MALRTIRTEEHDPSVYEAGILRKNAVFTEVAVHPAGRLADCEPIDKQDFANGAVKVPAHSPLTNLTFYGCEVADGAYVPLYDSDGNAAAVAVAAFGGYEFPPEVSAWPFIKITDDAESGQITVVLLG